MKLKLLDINDFIESRKVKEVSSTKQYIGGGKLKLDPKGLYSEEIFGLVSQPKRKRTFGYTDLKTKIIHPEAFPILISIGPNISKVLMGKDKFIVDDKGRLIQDPSGSTGVSFFIKNFDKINFEYESKGKKSNIIKFVEDNRQKILIDKYLVWPAGIRDIQVSQQSGKVAHQFSDLNTLYERLLRQAGNIIGDINLMPEEFSAPMIDRIQRTLKDISTWVKDRMKGKQGLIRGGMLKKITDYSGRMVITPDPSLKLGFIGIPWQFVIKLFEPFSLHYLLMDKENTSKLFGDSDINELKRIISNANLEPYGLSKDQKEYLYEKAKVISKDKVIVYKRDPAENRDSWVSCYVRVDDTGYSAKINPFDLNRNGGDV